MNDNTHSTTAILNATDAPIVVLDRAGQPTYCNPAWEQLTGYPLAEIEGSPIWDESLSPDGQAIFESLRPARPSQKVESRYETKDGRKLFLTWTLTAVFDDRLPVR